MTGSMPTPPPVKASTDGPRTGVPRLTVTQDNAFWFEAARQGKLAIQKCDACDTYRHPPTPACPRCRSFAWSVTVASGRCTLHSWTVIHHPQDPAFVYPLAVGLVDLAEGTRLVADIQGVPHDDLRVGMSLAVTFAEHAHGEILPQLRPALEEES